MIDVLYLCRVAKGKGLRVQERCDRDTVSSRQKHCFILHHHLPCQNVLSPKIGRQHAILLEQIYGDVNLVVHLGVELPQAHFAG